MLLSFKFFSLKHLTQELNNEQLGWFTRPQAQAVTAEQKGLLTNQGKEALEGAVTPVAGEGNTKQRNNKPTKTSGYQPKCFALETTTIQMSSAEVFLVDRCNESVYTITVCEA